MIKGKPRPPSVMEGPISLQDRARNNNRYTFGQNVTFDCNAAATIWANPNYLMPVAYGERDVDRTNKMDGNRIQGKRDKEIMG
jgi:hypothetical protein